MTQKKTCVTPTHEMRIAQAKTASLYPMDGVNNGRETEGEGGEKVAVGTGVG